MRSVAWLGFCAFLFACGPAVSSGDDDDQSGDGGGGVDAGFATPDAYFGPTGNVSGTVWAPGNAPGMVPAGQEIPVFDALVWVSPNRPDPIPQNVYCDRCVDNPGKHVFSDHKGNFSLTNVVPGTYWLAIQKGQFRIEQQVSIGEGTLEMTAEQTTLPSEQNPDAGKWIPKIAIAVGSYDDLEDILGKMGIGTVDSSGRFEGVSAAGALEFYSNGDYTLDDYAVESLTWLVSDLDRMRQFHIIFIPCSSTANVAALNTQDNLRNIRDFVKEGGKLYVTDWSGEWNDNVFPAQIRLKGSTEDTPAEAYDPITDTWNTALFGDADGSSYTAYDGEAVDEDLFAWLDGQQGPTAESSASSTYDASNFVVEGNWNTILELVSVEIGEDDEGLPVMDVPKAFVIGSNGVDGKLPLTVTHEPIGCGRVLFSTYHTTDITHVGLVPQERVLVYLIMEIGVCTDDPIIE